MKMNNYTLSKWMLQDIDLHDLVSASGNNLTNSALVSMTYGVTPCTKSGQCGNCEGGGCQSSTSNSCTAASERCSEGCGCQSCISCQSCQLDCRTCNSTCESSCTQCGACQSNPCQGATCQTVCEADCCQSGCHTPCESGCCEGVCNTGCQVSCRCSYEGGQCTCQNQGIVCQTCQSFCEVGKEALYKHIDSGNQFVYVQPIDTTSGMLEDDADWNALTAFITKGIAVYKKYVKYDSAMAHKTNVSSVTQNTLLKINDANTVNQAINEFINCATGIGTRSSGSLTTQNEMIVFKTNMNKATISKKVPCCQNVSKQECISQQ